MIERLNLSHKDNTTLIKYPLIGSNVPASDAKDTATLIDLVQLSLFQYTYHDFLGLTLSDPTGILKMVLEIANQYK